MIAVTETFLSVNQPDAYLSLDGYNFFRVDREGQEGGGVGIYVRDYYKVKIICQSKGKIPEFLIAELINTITKLLFAVVYRRPAATPPVHFSNCLSPLLSLYKNVIITGDFNNNMCAQNHITAPFSSLFESLSLQLVPSEPTHYVFRVDREPTHTWLDLFIKNLDSAIDLKKYDSPFIAGHDFIELLYKCAKPIAKKKTIKSRCL